MTTSTVAEFALDVPGGRLVGHVGATGHPLLLLHGGPGLSDYLGDLLPEADGWRTARYTQRGVVPSVATGPYSLDRHVDDVVAVLDHLGWDRPVLLGHSWGAFLACAVAARRPDRVAALVLVDGLGVVGDGGTEPFGAALVARTPDADRARLDVLLAREEDGSATDADALEQLGLLWPGYFAPGAAPAMPSDLRLSAEVNTSTFTTIFADLAAGQTAAGLARFTGPLELVVGAASPMPQTAATDTAALVAGAHVTVVPDAGHFPWIERPGCVRDALARVSLRLTEPRATTA